MAKDVVPVSGEAEVDPRIQRRIWKLLGIRSAREIADEVGISPEDVLRIKKEMLDSVDVLSVAEKRQKLLVDLEELSYQARDRAERMPDEFYAGALNSSVAAMKTILTELGKTNKGEQEALERLNALRVQELVRLVRATVDGAVRELSITQGISEEELYEVFNRHLRDAAEEADQ